VASKDLIIDFDQYDVNNVVADIEAIRKYNLQRFEMEQLSAIVYEDIETNVCVGYKDVTDEEFWVRGHMPGMPLMPGVIMCEAAAQLASYFAQKYDLMGADVVGFGGLEEVRFRGTVLLGDRLVVAATLLKVRRKAMLIAGFQGFVNQSLVVEGKIKGIALPIEEMQKVQSGRAT
jgi:3-hydroxyacyl-[acyl-carrier-protein] dehydratase